MTDELHLQMWFTSDSGFRMSSFKTKIRGRKYALRGGGGGTGSVSASPQKGGGGGRKAAVNADEWEFVSFNPGLFGRRLPAEPSPQPPPPPPLPPRETSPLPPPRPPLPVSMATAAGTLTGTSLVVSVTALSLDLESHNYRQPITLISVKSCLITIEFVPRT